MSRCFQEVEACQVQALLQSAREPAACISAEDRLPTVQLCHAPKRHVCCACSTCMCEQIPSSAAVFAHLALPLLPRHGRSPSVKLTASGHDHVVKHDDIFRCPRAAMSGSPPRWSQNSCLAMSPGWAQLVCQLAGRQACLHRLLPTLGSSRRAPRAAWRLAPVVGSCGRRQACLPTS